MQIPWLNSLVFIEFFRGLKDSCKFILCHFYHLDYYTRAQSRESFLIIGVQKPKRILTFCSVSLKVKTVYGKSLLLLKTKCTVQKYWQVSSNFCLNHLSRTRKWPVRGQKNSLTVVVQRHQPCFATILFNVSIKSATCQKITPFFRGHMC